MRDLLFPVQPIGRVVDLDTVNGPKCSSCDLGHHRECTGCDCPICRVWREDPYQYAPESVKAARDFLRAKGEAVASGKKRVASIGRILPHSRRRA